MSLLTSVSRRLRCFCDSIGSPVVSTTASVIPVGSHVVSTVSVIPVGSPVVSTTASVVPVGSSDAGPNPSAAYVESRLALGSSVARDAA